MSWGFLNGIALVRRGVKSGALRLVERRSRMNTGSIGKYGCEN
jgi:hypothetical protein